LNVIKLEQIRPKQYDQSDGLSQREEGFRKEQALYERFLPVPLIFERFIDLIEDDQQPSIGSL
jgi:hypothetical protein